MMKDIFFFFSLKNKEISFGIPRFFFYLSCRGIDVLIEKMKASKFDNENLWYVKFYFDFLRFWCQNLEEILN